MVSRERTAGLTLTLVPGRFSICRREPDTAIPAWATSSDFFSVTRTADELSIVCAQDAVPVGENAEPGWACLKVEGPLDFSLTGVMASLATPIARAEISLFAISTYDTDFLLIQADVLEEALTALRTAGHHVNAHGQRTS